MTSCCHGYPRVAFWLKVIGVKDDKLSVIAAFEVKDPAS
jgi:hypothetical protein